MHHDHEDRDTTFRLRSVGPRAQAPSVDRRSVGKGTETWEAVMNRKLLWAFLAIGIALFAAPLVISLPGKAAAGERMMQNFQPIMQPDQVKTTVMYYDDVFVPLGKVAPALNDQTVAKFQGYLQGMGGMQAEGQKLMATLASQTGMSQAQLQAYMAKEYPSMTGLLQNMPQLQKDFGGLMGMMAANTSVFAQVPAGLDHYEPLVATMNTNVSNYEQVSSLPNFRLFTAFFMVPGALIALLAVAGLVAAREERVRLPKGSVRPTASH